MSAWEQITWLYSLYTLMVRNCVLLHGNVWILLSMLFQAFVGWGLFATALYRVYVIKTGIRDFSEEFASYGLPYPGIMVILVCLMEFGIAAVFTAGIIVHDLVFLTSMALAALMVLAVLARIKGKEHWHKMIPASLFGLVSVGCMVIDQSADVSDAVLGNLISFHGRTWLTICVMAGDLVTIGVTVYRYNMFVKDKPQDSTSKQLKAQLLRRHSSVVLDAVV